MQWEMRRLTVGVKEMVCTQVGPHFGVGGQAVPVRKPGLVTAKWSEVVWGQVLMALSRVQAVTVEDSALHLGLLALVIPTRIVPGARRAGAEVVAAPRDWVLEPLGSIEGVEGLEAVFGSDNDRPLGAVVVAMVPDSADTAAPI